LPLWSIHLQHTPSCPCERFKPSLASEKVITVITAKDIPSGGENVGTSLMMLGDEALFADPVAEFAGQNIGVVAMFL